jgi:hypothetical protein
MRTRSLNRISQPAFQRASAQPSRRQRSRRPRRPANNSKFSSLRARPAGSPGWTIAPAPRESGPATRFTPNPGSWFAHQHDEYGTGVEVYPAGTELRPAGPEGAGFAMTEPNPFRARLAVPLLRAWRRRLPRDGSLAREYWHGRVADAGLRHRISDADPPARGARGLTGRRLLSLGMAILRWHVGACICM